MDFQQIVNQRRPLPLEQKLGYILDVARALQKIHKQAIRHGDIKPANMLLSEDGSVTLRMAQLPHPRGVSHEATAPGWKLVLTRFLRAIGFAGSGNAAPSQSGLLLGTIKYMSPEQARGEAVDHRSDIFSLGASSYEMISYQHPYPGNSITEVMQALVTREPESLDQVIPGCPKDLAECVDKLLHKNLTDRYQTVDDFLKDVEPIWKRMCTQPSSSKPELD